MQFSLFARDWRQQKPCNSVDALLKAVNPADNWVEMFAQGFAAASRTLLIWTTVT